MTDLTPLEAEVLRRLGRDHYPGLEQIASDINVRQGEGALSGEVTGADVGRALGSLTQKGYAEIRPVWRVYKYDDERGYFRI